MYIASPYRNSAKTASLRGKGYMGISLNSQSHCDEALDATVEWINKNTQYDTFLIGLSDTLNRFNYNHEVNALDLCLKTGNKWINRNKSILDKLNTPYKIVRWDHWKENYPNKVKQYIQFFENLFESDLTLKSALIKDIDGFVKRRHQTTINNVSFGIIQNCKNYLIEELAVYSIIFEAYPECEVFYPGKQLECMAAIRDGSVQAIPGTYENTKYIRMALHSVEQKTAA